MLKGKQLIKQFVRYRKFNVKYCIENVTVVNYYTTDIMFLLYAIIMTIEMHCLCCKTNNNMHIEKCL